eukprot:scaffold1852_cov170-Amphora_coffeaeformis.AAC.6
MTKNATPAFQTAWLYLARRSGWRKICCATPRGAFGSSAGAGGGEGVALSVWDTCECKSVADDSFENCRRVVLYITGDDDLANIQRPARGAEERPRERMGALVRLQTLILMWRCQDSEYVIPFGCSDSTRPRRVSVLSETESKKIIIVNNKELAFDEYDVNNNNNDEQNPVTPLLLLAINLQYDPSTIYHPLNNSSG